MFDFMRLGRGLLMDNQHHRIKCRNHIRSSGVTKPEFLFYQDTGKKTLSPSFMRGSNDEGATEL